MEYDILPEFHKYAKIRMPVNPCIIQAANVMMPVIQHGKNLYPGCLECKKNKVPEFYRRYVYSSRQKSGKISALLPRRSFSDEGCCIP